MDLDELMEANRRQTEIIRQQSEKRRQAKAKANTQKPVQNQEVIVPDHVRRHQEEQQARRTRQRSSAVQRPQAPSTPAQSQAPGQRQAPVKSYSVAKNPGVKRRQIIRGVNDALKPYSQVDRSDPNRGRFAEMTERMFIDQTDEAQRNAIESLRNGTDEDLVRRRLARSQGFRIGRDADAIEQLMAAARRGRRSPEISMAVPYTAGRENLMRSLLTMSGRDAESLNLGRVQATDLVANFDDVDKLIDVQDMFSDEALNLNVFKRAYGTEEAWKNASSSDTLLDISNRISQQNTVIGRGKLLQGTDGPLRGFRLDQNMRDSPDQFRKDYLIGGKYKPEANLLPEGRNRFRGQGIGDPTKGTFDPKMFQKGYALDLDETRNILLPMTKGELDDLGISPRFYDTSLDLNIPASSFKDIGGGQSVRNNVFSESVQDVLRKDFGADFYAAVGTPQQADDLLKGLKKGWRGGIGATLANGASREAAVKLGQGDVGGAAREFGQTYAIGAVADKGIRMAGQQVMKRLPGIASRFAAGSGGSGGLATPLMAGWAAYDVADGLTEGITGKGLSKRMEEGTDQAVVDAYERRFGTPAPERGAVPKDAPLPAQQPVKNWSTERIDTARQLVERAATRHGVKNDSTSVPTAEISAPEPQQPERNFGQEAVLNGKKVKWGGNDYGWQSEESFNTIEKPREKFLGLF